MGDVVDKKKVASVNEKTLTDKEKALIDKRRETSARNAEKARLKRMEKKQQKKEIEQIEYLEKRKEFNQKIETIAKANVEEIQREFTKPIEDSESDEEEEYIIYNAGKKKKIIQEANEELFSKIDKLSQELESLKAKPVVTPPVVTPPTPPVVAPPQAQTITKIIHVKPPNSDFTHHLKQKILNF